MEPARMVHMANQIALFFAAYPRERAEAGVVEHIEKFWTPAMRRQLGDYAQSDGSGLHDLVRAAARRIAVPSQSG